jgi:DNA repair exonuclease SbcCD ATPase subunit
VGAFQIIAKRGKVRRKEENRDEEMTTRAEIEAKLNQQAQRSISRMLDQLEQDSNVNLDKLEEATQILGETLLQSTLQEVASYYAQTNLSDVTCPSCGGQVYRRGARLRHLVTQHGDIEVQRTYYTCRACGQGHFPPR